MLILTTKAEDMLNSCSYFFKFDGFFLHIDKMMFHWNFFQFNCNFVFNLVVDLVQQIHFVSESDFVDLLQSILQSYITHIPV